MLEEIGPDQKIWARALTNTSSSGAQSTSLPGRGKHRVIEIATGMNYWDGQNWVPSDPSFDVTPDAFVAQRTQHKVRLEAGNLNQIGAVTVTTPDGIVLRSTPVGIGLYDAATGDSAVIAAVADSAGILVSSNEVLYPDAFNANGVRADIIYKIQNHSFGQYVVFRERLNPADYGFPIETTRIQIFTEFYRAPQPDRIVRPIRVEPDKKIRDRMVSPDLVDEILGWGELAIATGQARMTTADSSDGAAAAAIVKQFTNLLGRSFLIESVDYNSIDRELAALPENAGKTAFAQPNHGIKKARRGYAKIPSPRPVEQANAAEKPRAKRMASALNFEKRPGVALDYLAEISGNITQAKTFQGDTTYVLTAPVTCSSTVTIEGGAVFKYSSSSTTSYLKLSNTLTCKTSSYHPAIFTAVDDDSVGDAAPGSTGWPSGFY
ncbi:MAG TPA: hypothetical protein VK639_12710, partial [Terriglobales bacterium]|nr:hypothetical protein [Terriglobales bacterium]